MLCLEESEDFIFEGVMLGSSGRAEVGGGWGGAGY